MKQLTVQQSMPIVWAVWDKRLASQLVLAVAGVAALTLSAKFQIPWWPVPMTMQTYVVLVIGMAYGTRLAVGTIVAYLAAGALGLPVFAGTPEKGNGLAYMMGPTGGYLLGFAIAAWVCGTLAARGWDRHLLGSLAAMTVGHVLILAIGVAWLSVLMGWHSAVSLGLMPFIAATVLKTLLATVTLPAAWGWVARVRGA
jgi:biotin transport system substrate-specific component